MSKVCNHMYVIIVLRKQVDLWKSLASQPRQTNSVRNSISKAKVGERVI